MAFVITEKCKGNKNAACVVDCPTESIHPTPGEAEFDKAEQLFIDPDNCIDCNMCATACPAGAIFQEDEVPAESLASIVANAAYFAAK